MSYIKKVTADALIQALYDSDSLFNLGNRSYDSLVAQGGSSVDIDAMPLLVAKTSGTAPTGADRKTPADTTKVNVPLALIVVPIGTYKIDQFSTNGRMMKDFIMGARDAMIEKMDTNFLTQLETTTDKTNMKGASFSWADITNIHKRMSDNKVPKRDRVIILSTAIEEEFYDIDIIKTAMTNDRNLLENGVWKIRNTIYAVSSLVPQVGGKDVAVGFYKPGIAFILSKYMDNETAWDTTNLIKTTDFISNSGQKLTKNAFAVVKKHL